MNTKTLDTQLHRLMWSGREYTLDELMYHTGLLKEVGCMNRKSFRNRMAERKDIYRLENKKYRCIAVLLPAPCELRRSARAWLKKIMS